MTPNGRRQASATSFDIAKLNHPDSQQPKAQLQTLRSTPRTT